MFVPRHRAAFHVPDSLVATILAVIAITATIVAWAVFGARTTSNEENAVLAMIEPGRVGSVAYSVSEGGQDNVYVRPSGVLGVPRLIASFRPFQPAAGLHIRGEASPRADRLAILSVGQPVAAAQLTFVSLPSGDLREATGAYDHLSELAWTRDGLRVAVVGEDRRTVLEVDSDNGTAAVVARFTDARQVAPVGYRSNGQRLYVVVIDQAGSTLWSIRGGQRSKVATLSAGLTVSWSLSPDGSRLAYVEVVGVGGQRFAGRTLMVATGETLSAGPEGDQLGAAWRPGSEVAEFGGPGGSFSLITGPLEGSAYVVPTAWAPDGRWLVASIISAGSDAPTTPTQTLELVMPGQPVRVSLSDTGQPVFLGFVLDME